MKDTYIAYYAPDDNIDTSKRGFKTEEDAWNYIKTQLCRTCLQDLNRGHVEYDFDGIVDRSIIEHPGDTSCGAEWFVLKEKDYDEAEDFGDILGASGYEIYNPKDKEEK